MSTVSPNGMIAKAGDRGHDRDQRREREEPPDRGARAELLLGDELDDVGHRLQDPERADAVGPVAVLEAPEQLALDDEHDGHELQADGEDHDRLEDLHPPRLVVADLGEGQAGHALRTSTSGPSSALVLQEDAALGRAARSATVRVDARAVGADDDAVALEELEALGVGGRHLDALRGCRKCSAGETRTSVASQIERNVPSAGGRWAGAGGGGAGSTARRSAREARTPRRAPASARPGRRSRRASARRRTGTAATSCGRHRPGEDAEVEADAPREVGEHRPLGARRRPGGRSPAQALQAPVGVRQRALLLGVALGREDDGGVLADALGEEVGVRDDGGRALERALPGAPAAGRQRVGVQQVERGQLAARAPAAIAAASRPGRGSANPGRRWAARPPRPGRGRWCRRARRAGPRPRAAGEAQALGEVEQRAGAWSARGPETSRSP
jgi:hypothetical protein